MLDGYEFIGSSKYFDFYTKDERYYVFVGERIVEVPKCGEVMDLSGSNR